MAGQRIAKTKQWPVSILQKNNKNIFLRKHGKSCEIEVGQRTLISKSRSEEGLLAGQHYASKSRSPNTIIGPVKKRSSDGTKEKWFNFWSNQIVCATQPVDI